MQKLLKKSATDKKAKTAPSYIRSRGDNITTTMWQDTCDATMRKFNTVIPQHNALQPASPEFLKNYEEIDWHRNDNKESTELTEKN